MIEIKNLTQAYGKNIVLDNINLKVENGSVYGLLGKNGAGKTTLINLLVDLFPVDIGTILINGKKNNTLSKEDKRSIGIVGEDLALIEELSGLEYLNFVGKIYGLSQNILNKRIEDLFHFFFEDDKDLSKNISKYSTGMKKKIAFCAAVIHTPNILILDEPFSGLDPLVANQMISFLHQYQKNDRTILISSHDLNYVEKIATHIGVLNEKELQFNSSLQDFTENGINSLDKALMKILQPGEIEQSKIDWV